MGFQDLRHGIKPDKDDVDELDRIKNTELYPEEPEDRPIENPGPCPRCGSDEHWSWTGAYYVCDNPDCDDVRR